MNAFRALIVGLLLTAVLAPVASADDTDVCIRDGQVVTGPDCYAAGEEDPNSTTVPICIRDGRIIIGESCYG